MKFKSLAAGAAVAVLASMAMGGAAGAVVITNGTISVGVNQYGQLFSNDPSGAEVGLKRNGGADVIYANAPRDSWGVNGAYADDVSGDSLDVFAIPGESSDTADSAVVAVSTGDFKIVQSFSFVADDVLAIQIDLTNTSGAALDAIFQRLSEFHVDPNGAEYATNPYSTGIQNTTVGFEDASASGDWFFPCCFSDPFDYGAGFRLDLGAMAANQTRSFTYYYGLGGGDIADQLKAAGASDVVMVANDGATAAAAMGVSIGVVPEPATWAMMILGFFGLGSILRRRRAALA
jgi:hypothetical protein